MKNILSGLLLFLIGVVSGYLLCHYKIVTISDDENDDEDEDEIDDDELRFDYSFDKTDMTDMNDLEKLDGID